MINSKILRMFLRFQRHLGSLLRIDCGRWAIPEPDGEID